MSAGPYSIGSNVWAGLSKLIEEMGEAGQVVGKLIATSGETAHWDGTDLRQRLSEETADVAAAIDFVTAINGLDTHEWRERRREKAAQFLKWHHEQGAAAMPEWHERQLADRIAAGERATVPADYAARRAAGEGGHGMATRWRPTVGARVVTADPLTSNEYAPSGRRPGALGILISLETGWTGAMVRHDDGAEAPYDADERAPAPEAAK